MNLWISSNCEHCHWDQWPRQSWLQNNWLLFSVVEGLFPLGRWSCEVLQTSCFSNRIAVVCSNNKYKVHIDYLPWCVLRKRPKALPWGPRMYPRSDSSPRRNLSSLGLSLFYKKHRKCVESHNHNKTATSIQEVSFKHGKSCTTRTRLEPDPAACGVHHLSKSWHFIHIEVLPLVGY